MKKPNELPSLIEGGSFGASRFAIAMGMLLFHLVNFKDSLVDLPLWQSYPQSFWLPVGFFRLLPLELFQKIPVIPVYGLHLVSLFFFGIGWKSRPFAFLTLITSLFLMGLPNNYGTVYDSTCMIHVFFLVALFSPNLKQYSLDQRRKGPYITKINDYSLIFIQILFLGFYVISGIQKFRIGGLQFFNSDHLSLILLSNGNSLGQWLSQFSTLNKVIAFLVLFFQISSFSPIFLRKLIKPWIGLLLLFHLAVNMTLGPHFYPHVMLFFLFVPWENLLPMLGSSSKVGKRTRLLNLLVLPVIAFFFLLSPVTKDHYWPFSTMTMYSWPAQYETKEYQLMSDKGQISFDHFRPYDHDRLHSLIEQLHHKKEDKRLHQIINDLLERDASVSSLGLFQCQWKNTKRRLKNPDSPESCEEIAITDR